MPLTDATIRNLKPRDKSYKMSDFEGLFLLVKPTGLRLWHQKYRIDGKEELLAIGPYPQVSLTQARQVRDAARLADLKKITGNSAFVLPSLVSSVRVMSENTPNTALRRITPPALRRH